MCVKTGLFKDYFYKVEVFHPRILFKIGLRIFLFTMERTNRRRKLTLDLNAASQAVAKKKTREHEIHANNCVLTSPDVQMLKLTSPQMREFITR